MSKPHFILVVYDISDDRRRTRLHDRLLDYGTPVQYSVFECLVEDSALVRMKKAVDRIIKPRLDRVRYYELCTACQRKIEVTEVSVEATSDEDCYVV